MEEIKNIEVWDSINKWITIIGIPTLCGVLVFIGKKLQILDTLKEEMDKIVKPELKGLGIKMARMEGASAGLTATNSPVSLTVAGEHFLNNSGLKKYIDDNFDTLKKHCTKLGNLNSPYDIQESVFRFFSTHQLPKEVELEVKNYSFSQGASFDVAKNLGAIYFRNLCLKEKGFNLKDLEKKNTK